MYLSVCSVPSVSVRSSSPQTPDFLIVSHEELYWPELALYEMLGEPGVDVVVPVGRAGFRRIVSDAGL